MREPVQLQFEFMNDCPPTAPAAQAQPASDPIKAFAIMVTMFEVAARHFAAERQAARRQFGLAAR